MLFRSFGLMDEVEQLVCGYLRRNGCQRLSYTALFLEYLGIDPLRAATEELATLARHRLDTDFADASRDTWLGLLLSGVIEPQLAHRGLVFVFDYPATQAALAKVGARPDGAAVGHRFELYVDGVELANGYWELLDESELGARFSLDVQVREAMNRPLRHPDTRLLAALQAGLPSCSGVALGIDRLLMLAAGTPTLSSVTSFSWSNA